MERVNWRESAAERHCWECRRALKAPAMLQTCARCQTALYCSVACHEAHWAAEHHRQCQPGGGTAFGHLATAEEIKRDDFLDRFFDGQPVMIGRGGRGSVYRHPELEGVVVKVSTVKDACRGNNDEYRTMNALAGIFQVKGYNFRNVELVRTWAFIADKLRSEHALFPADVGCYIIMDHVAKPTRGLVSASPLTLQCYFNQSSLDVVHKGRGEYVGCAEIGAILAAHGASTTVEDLIWDMGRFIAAVQLVANFDGMDLEYVLGYVHDDPNDLKVVAIDFDLCKPILDWNDDDAIYRCYWAIDAEEYFPKPDCDFPEHYNLFKKAYMSVAERAQRLDVAEVIFVRLEASAMGKP